LPTSRLLPFASVAPLVPAASPELFDMPVPPAFIPSYALHGSPGWISRGAHVLAAMMLVCAGGVQVAAAAGTPKPMPIDATTSVTETPLGETASAASDAEAALPDGFATRQKDLDKRSEANNYQYGVAQHDCYSTFFVNHCLNQARNAKREVSNQIRREQLALDDEQRQRRAQQRDQQAALKRAQYEADAPRRVASEQANENSFSNKQHQNQIAAAQREAEAPQRAANQAAYDRKQADFQKKLDDAAAQGKQDAINRDLKAQRYDAKQRDAAQHQAEVAARQKEAAEKQQQHAQEAAAAQKQQEQQQQPK
jgi:hypothetical protein